MFAGHKGLDNLCWIIDYNGLQIDGPVFQSGRTGALDSKLRDFGFDVIPVEDGHDFEKLEEAFQAAKTANGIPKAILARTHKGKGVSFMEDQVGWHGAAPQRRAVLTGNV